MIKQQSRTTCSALECHIRVKCNKNNMRLSRPYDERIAVEKIKNRLDDR